MTNSGKSQAIIAVRKPPERVTKRGPFRRLLVWMGLIGLALVVLDVVASFTMHAMTSSGLGSLAQFNSRMSHWALTAALLRISVLGMAWLAWPHLAAMMGRIRQWPASQVAAVATRSRQVPLLCLMFEIGVFDLPLWLGFITGR